MSVIAKKLVELGLSPNYIVEIDTKSSDNFIPAIYSENLMKTIDESKDIYGFRIVAGGLTFSYHREDEKWLLDYVRLPNGIALSSVDLNNVPVNPEDEEAKHDSK
jgi:hypothetical protein